MEDMLTNFREIGMGREGEWGMEGEGEQGRYGEREGITDVRKNIHWLPPIYAPLGIEPTT